ncbi:MAG: transposase [Kouleothrix sp.]
MELDACVVMPDHLHGILALADQPPAKHTPAPVPARGQRPNGTLPGTIGRIVQAYKSLSTRAYVDGVKRRGWMPFTSRLWQRNYYERIIRNQAALNAVRAYIERNPSEHAAAQTF